MLLAAGATVCLGTDGFYNVAQQMTLAPILQNVAQRNPSAFGGSLQMVYGHNAALAEQTFGLPFGRVAPGYAADLLLLPYDPTTPAHAGNLGAHLSAALAGGPRDVIIGGRMRVRQGRVLGADVAVIKAEARRRAAALWERL
jgi:cytosine/adenosine deaminase-related metal-dependent hydrolase